MTEFTQKQMQRWFYSQKFKKYYEIWTISWEEFNLL